MCTRQVTRHEMVIAQAEQNQIWREHILRPQIQSTKPSGLREISTDDAGKISGGLAAIAYAISIPDEEDDCVCEEQ